MFRSLLFSILLLTSIFSFSQGNEEELAAQYYANGEYDKAATLYKRIHKDKPNSLYIYENYLNCLIALDDQKEAVKLVEKQVKRSPLSFNYAIDLGYVLFYFKEDERAEKHFEALIKEYAKDRNRAYSLAQAFERRQYTDWAIRTYEIAADHNGIMFYWQQLLFLYRVSGDHEKMAEMGLDVLHQYPRNIDLVLRHFSQSLEEAEPSAYIVRSVLSYIQRYPNEPVFDELLMRIYIQQEKYQAAFRQVQAMDRRNNEDGRRFLQLADQCLKNKAYDVAEQCYQAVIDKGEKSILYMQGKEGKLETLYLMITDAYNPDSASVVKLIDSYEGFVFDYGYSPSTAESVRRLAELQLFYAKDVKRAINVLEKLLSLQNLHPGFIGNSKLLLADAYLIDGEIWEAKLLYGQVDKEFKEEPLGQEAKFRSARLSYFTGDFDWARDQLDILKTATTQLISNNAIELSLLIQDNTGLDSTEDAMKAYADAEFLLFQNKPEACMRILNMLPFQYPNHSLQDEIFYLKGRVMASQGDHAEALRFYEMVYESFADDILADNALFKAAEIQQYVMKDMSKARALYEQIILNYNSSLYVIEARKRYRELEEINP